MPKQRETCTECSIRRQKCDKALPACGRCVRRGVASRCTRVWSRATTSTRRSLSENIEREIGIAPDALRQLSKSGTRVFLDEVNPLSNAESSPVHHDLGSTLAPAPVSTAPSGVGRDKGHSGSLQLELPPIPMIWQLVRFHERSLLWYHGCYHGPTFRGELQARVVSERDHVTIEPDLQWSALLFAILAGSLICANDKQLVHWNFRKVDVAKQATRWYNASVACLEAADFTANYSLKSVQAIATLTTSAHTLGLSSKQAVLLACATKVAQSLGIHRLSFESAVDSITSDSSDNDRKRVLDRETRRRLWSQLCAQDWFSAPSNEGYSINPLFSTSIKPANRDFITMEMVPDHIPTYVSYGNYLNDIARLLAGLQEALATSHTIFSRYERVMEFDAEMRDLATKQRPVYFNVTEPVNPDWQDFVPWARRSLTICFSHKSKSSWLALFLERALMAR
jgi:hypothetical protein